MLREVEVPRDVDVETDVLVARRIGAEAVEENERLVVDTLVTARVVLFTRRRSFSLPRAT